MNCVALIGRLTKDPIVNYTQSGSSITKFGLAVDRRFKTNDGQTADFLNIVVFGKSGEFVEKWFHKGDPISVVGRIQTGSYTKQDGTKVYTTDIIADSVEFVPKNSGRDAEKAADKPVEESEGFMDVPEEVIPF